MKPTLSLSFACASAPVADRARAAAPATAPKIFRENMLVPSSLRFPTFRRRSEGFWQEFLCLHFDQINTTLLTGQARTARPGSPALRWPGHGAARGAEGPGSSRDTAPPTAAATARRTGRPGRGAAARSRRRRYRRRPAAQPGRQAAKTTSARAIQPRPAVMPGDQKRV